MKKFNLTRESRLDPKLAVVSAVNPKDHKDLLMGVCCNSVTGYVIEKSNCVTFANYAIEAVVSSLKSRGFEEE